MLNLNEKNILNKNQKKSFLKKRFEFKYILDFKKAIRIEKYLRTIGLVPDKHSQDKPYLVNSLYFDTPTLTDYRDKDGSVLKRKKLRARTYSDKWSENLDMVWLEIKKKHNMNINKTRVSISKDVWKDLYKNNKLSLDVLNGGVYDDGLVEFAYLFNRYLYRPHVIIKYERMAYMGDFMDPIRITFDMNVVVSKVEDLVKKDMPIKVTKNKIIMEVKYSNKLPWWFKNLLSSFDIQRSDFSKYRNSVAMLRGYSRIEVHK